MPLFSLGASVAFFAGVFFPLPFSPFLPSACVWPFGLQALQASVTAISKMNIIFRISISLAFPRVIVEAEGGFPSAEVARAVHKHP